MMVAPTCRGRRGRRTNGVWLISKRRNGARLSGALSPGAAVDCRGVPFTQELREELKTAVDNTFVGDAFFWLAHFLHDASFDEVTFSGDVLFEEAVFEFGASFEYAQFHGPAWFQDALFAPDADFAHVTFAGEAFFSRTQIFGEAFFHYAQFSHGAVFVSAEVEEKATFDGATFGQDAVFAGARFKGDARFPGTEFAQRLAGPIVCGGVFDLSQSVLRAPVRIRIAAARLDLLAAQIDAAVSLVVRYVDVHMQDVTLSRPVAINFHPRWIGSTRVRGFLEGVTAEPACVAWLVAGTRACSSMPTGDETAGPPCELWPQPCGANATCSSVPVRRCRRGCHRSR